ncbi:hypothetical protein PR202_gb08401 [Eleusine coracana subsp. coracana]|uniref:Uncharacterized protein n=1 Tax=Eleusine coracana subsp. coracana TaxID=191504 RepID=A0AAV5EE87_ELECO|nr:hypothetical protein PR202_gb08401 [Eleusine coracana subsp. coracana]
MCRSVVAEQRGDVNEAGRITVTGRRGVRVGNCGHQQMDVVDGGGAQERGRCGVVEEVHSQRDGNVCGSGRGGGARGQEGGGAC